MIGICDAVNKMINIDFSAVDTERKYASKLKNV